MKKSELHDLSQDQKIEYLIQKVEAIDRTVNPPLWKQIIQWLLSNFWTLLFLFIISYFLWQVWEVVQAVQAQVDALNTRVSGIKESVSDSLKPVSEGIDSVKNSLQKIDLENVKFW